MAHAIQLTVLRSDMRHSSKESTFEESAPARHGLTLFSLLVTIAAFTPFVAVLAKRDDQGTTGLVISFCIASIFGATQFVAHHRLADLLSRSFGSSKLAEPLFVLYYLSIPVIGSLCAAITIWLGRFSARLCG